MYVGVKYAERLMRNYMLPGLGEDAIREIARQFAYGYHHHGYVINADEARSIGLKIVHPDDIGFAYMQNLVDVIKVSSKPSLSDKPMVRLLSEREMEYVCNEPHAIAMRVIPVIEEDNMGKQNAG